MDKLWTTGVNTSDCGLISFSPMTQQPPVGQSLLITVASPSHSDTPQAVGPLDELPVWPAPRRDLYLTTHNTHETSMPPTGFKPAIPTSERPQNDVLGCAAAEIGCSCFKLSHRGKHTVVRGGGVTSAESMCDCSEEGRKEIRTWIGRRIKERKQHIFLQHVSYWPL